MHYLGLKHLHEQTSAHKKHKQTNYRNFLNRLTWFFGIVGPFTVMPQIYSIFSTHSASGVSLATWALIFIVTFPWILYGVEHRDKTIIVSFTMWEVVNLSVVIGVLLYGSK